MVNIVFEGPDHSGKSTFAKTAAEALGMPYQKSSGVPKTFEDVIDRARHYISLDGYVIDRHPCISQPIYGTLRNDPKFPQELIDEFHAQRPIIVYCCANRGIKNHVPSPGDSLEHIAALNKNYEKICILYDLWASRRADIIYRQYSDLTRILNMLGGAMEYEHRRH